MTLLVVKTTENASRSRAKVFIRRLRKLILVMDEAIRKEVNEVVKKVGSGSTWGRKERDRFNIPQNAVELDAVELIGHEWFDFSGLTTTQQQSMFLTSWNRC